MGPVSVSNMLPTAEWSHDAAFGLHFVAELFQNVAPHQIQRSLHLIARHQSHGALYLPYSDKELLLYQVIASFTQSASCNVTSFAAVKGVSVEVVVNNADLFALGRKRSIAGLNNIYTCKSWVANLLLHWGRRVGSAKGHTDDAARLCA